MWKNRTLSLLVKSLFKKKKTKNLEVRSVIVEHEHARVFVLNIKDVKRSASRFLTAIDKHHVLNVTVALVSDCRNTCMMFAMVPGSRSSRTKVVCVDLRGHLRLEFTD